jgi:hypothetical protein
MSRLIVLSNFRLIEPGTNRLIDFRRGMSFDERDLPADQTAERLIERGFVKRAGK